MAITLGSNIASLQAQRTLHNTGQQLSTVFERLSSGQRINRASDDAAGLAISESLHSDGRVYNQAVRNLNDGISVLNIADSTASELSSVVMRIQELAEQAANGALSHVQRESLDEEAQSLRDEFFRVSRSAEFNGLTLFDGSIEYGVRLQAGYGTDGSIFSSLGGEMGDGTFKNGVTVSTGTNPHSVSLGDLNGDGHVDIITANYSDDNISVLLGNGDGSFGSAKSYVVGDGADSISLGDINGDGILDVVSANYGGYDVTLLTGNGDGTFQNAVTIGYGDSPASTSLGDLNGDGLLDVVVSNYYGDNALILVGNGDGTFQDALTLNVGSHPGSVRLGDLNGDDNLDIVTSNAYGDNVSVLLGNGDGTFESAVNIGVGNFPRSVALGDLNGDDVLDIVTSNTSGGDFTVLLGNGDGSFQSAKTFGSGGAGQEIQLQDVNGDGQLDIISSKTYVSLGNGDGTFQSGQSFSPGSSPYSVALGDLDEDGVLDIVTANIGSDDASVLLGKTREGIAPILEFSLQTQSDALQAIAPLERKLNSLSEQRGVIGAFQSRLHASMNTLMSTSENYSAAESRIRDVDVAFESSQLTRLNILQQAASAVLGQANQQPALAITLLS